MGNKNSTTRTRSESRPSEPAWELYNSILRRAENASRTPYEGYEGQRVAEFNPAQRQAFNSINELQGAYKPYMQQASQYATQGAATISPEQIQGYSNPFQQQVIDATMANVAESNALQQNNVVGNAVAKGAWGGDRAGIAQAELARNQGLASNQTFAGLNAQNYQQALAAAQQDRSAAANAAYTFGNLGQLNTSLGLQEAGAQLQGGNLQQQRQQSVLNNRYGEFQERRAYPFQTLQWLSGIGTGVGSQMGGSNWGSTTTPGPSPFSQILGGGLALGSMFMGMPPGMAGMMGGAAGGMGGKAAYADGGAVEPFNQMQGFAEGGMAIPYGASPSFIPSSQITMGRGAPQAQAPQAQQQSSPASMVMTALDLADKIKGRRPTASAQPPQSAMPQPMMLDEGAYDRVGGFQPFADGGFVSDGIYIPRGFAEGGAPEPHPFFNEAFVDTPPAPAGLARPLAHAINDKYDPDYPIELTPEPITRTAEQDDDPAMPGVATLPPPPVAAPELDDADPSGLNPNGGVGLTDFSSQNKPIPHYEGQGSGNGMLSDNLRRALMTTGLAMMASKSPHVGQAIGEAGLQGVQSYEAHQKQQQENALKERTFGLQEKRVNLEAQRLAEHAKQTAAQLALNTRNVESQIEARNQTPALKEYKEAKAEGFTGSFQDFMAKKKASSGEYGLQPVYGVGPNGETVIMQLGKTGEVNQPKLPPGVTIGKTPIKLDTGTSYILLDPVTRQQIGVIPKNVSEKERLEEVGKSQGIAQQAIPSVTTTVNSALSAIDDLRKHPGLEIGTGLSSKIDPRSLIPGQPGYDFRALNEQVQGKAFMAARESLKGAGQVTDFEGRKGEQAIANLNTAQSKEQYLKALDTLEQMMKTSLDDLKKKAGQERPQGATAAPARAPDPLGIR